MVCQGWYRRILGKWSPEAKRRLQICMECKEKVKIAGNEYVCGQCGCPLKSAVLADDKTCDLGKW